MNNFNFEGQLSIFDFFSGIKKSPCQYSFVRYIGQLVRDKKGIHKVYEIEDYYTIFDDLTIGTPHDLVPVLDNEYFEYILNEIEYYNYLISSCKNYDSMRSIYENNLKILLEEKKKYSCPVVEPTTNRLN